MSMDPKKRTDSGQWATDVSRLNVSDVPEGAINLNVTGRRVTSPIQGFGKMWQKTYRVSLDGVEVEPAEVIARWKADFQSFWPPGSSFYAPITGIAPGEVALLNLTMPGRLKLSTGVLVMFADEESFTLMTPQGHMFAGWITFSSHAEPDGPTVAQAQVLMRANDPLYEIGLTLGGHKKEDRFWAHTLTALAAAFSDTPGGFTMTTTCVDKKRQWSKMGNIWHNAAIRSSLYALGAPFRKLKRRS